MEKRAGLKSPLNSMLDTNKTSQMQNIAEQNIKSFDYDLNDSKIKKHQARLS